MYIWLNETHLALLRCLYSLRFPHFIFLCNLNAQVLTCRFHEKQTKEMIQSDYEKYILYYIKTENSLKKNLDWYSVSNGCILAYFAISTFHPLYTLYLFRLLCPHLPLQPECQAQSAHQWLGLCRERGCPAGGSKSHRSISLSHYFLLGCHNQNSMAISPRQGPAPAL